jgi:hypothetical protein
VVPSVDSAAVRSLIKQANDAGLELQTGLGSLHSVDGTWDGLLGGNWRKTGQELTFEVLFIYYLQAEARKVDTAFQEQVQSLKQAHDSCRLVVEGLTNDRNQMMGAYELMEGKVVSGRAVWQKQG